MHTWCTDDALMMHWWCADDALIMHHWCADDALMMRTLLTNDALKMHWCCTEDALMMHWWCSDNAPLIRWWCSNDALMMHRGCTDDALMIQCWCIDDAPMMHIWRTDDAQLSYLISFSPFLSKNIAYVFWLSWKGVPPLKLIQKCRLRVSGWDRCHFLLSNPPDYLRYLWYLWFGLSSLGFLLWERTTGVSPVIFTLFYWNAQYPAQSSLSFRELRKAGVESHTDGLSSEGKYASKAKLEMLTQILGWSGCPYICHLLASLLCPCPRHSIGWHRTRCCITKPAILKLLKGRLEEACLSVGEQLFYM